MFSKILQNYSSSNIKNDVLSGIVVAVALVPEAIAFSIIAGVSPLVGLYTAFILGLITALFGGKPGMISGATGSVAVVMVSLVATHGVEYLFWATVLAGIIQILVGVFKFAKFIRLVPMPVVYGFVNGLAIIIAMAQFPSFKGESYIMYILVALTMAIMWFLPKFTKTIPAGLVAIIGFTLAIFITGAETKLVGDLANLTDFKGMLPSFSIPTTLLSLDALVIILPML